ncbi:MAG: hypothetical protein AVDCRST_MAG49-869 [uncultured Thermomicrobiales bacterium]|uniref:Uncharacterized protein n=1 Tax=uncultured Thermomicrobiales bacterium TaxID=1645740 RepID=A0A6J4U565_9BACT|nr:MAG: hypothetical protein AVDCRST_MAG49-869 [uncultured Thermomicrobiales bacterium]
MHGDGQDGWRPDPAPRRLRGRARVPALDRCRPLLGVERRPCAHVAPAVAPVDGVARSVGTEGGRNRGVAQAPRRDDGRRSDRRTARAAYGPTRSARGQGW